MIDFEVTAIKEQELKFGYCSKCRRFRQAYCYLNDERICSECVSARQIDVVNPPPPQPKPKKKSKPKQYKPLLDLKLKLVETLKGKCLNSYELYDLCGKEHYTDYDSFTWFLRSLHVQKIIYSCRWRANGPNYHVISSEKNLMAERIGKPPEERIMNALRSVEKIPVSKLARQVGMSRATAHGVSKRLQKDGRATLERSGQGQIIVSLKS